jgi:uncharacterized protein (TIGR02466 family)
MNLIEKHVAFTNDIFISKLDLTDDQRNAIINRIYDLENNDDEHIVISNMGGWQSKSYDNPTNLPEEIAIKQTMEILGEVMVDYNFKDPHIAHLGNYWFNINRKYDYNGMHNHPASNFSACFYLKVPEGKPGNIVFTRMDQTEHAIPRCNSNGRHGTYYVTAKEDIVVIFPSNMFHHVERNETDEDRISCAINFILKEGN